MCNMTTTTSYLSHNNQDRILSLQRELHQRKRNFGINHISVAETLNALALTYHHMKNDHETAIQIHYEAKHILEGQQERSQQILVNLAITVGDIGNCFCKKGDYQSARNEYMTSLQFFETCQISENHPKAKLCMYTMKYRLGLLQTSSIMHQSNFNECSGAPQKESS